MSTGPAALRTVRRMEHGSWLVTETTGSPGAFHALEPPPAPRREVWVHVPDRAALVLGSAQPAASADPAALRSRGVDLVRRHSGGGAVLVEPGGLTWVDVVLPAGDPLWQVDVGASFHWIGDVWAGALRVLGLAARVHRGGFVRRPWWREVCFAGLGAGEVLAGDLGPVDGADQAPKLVGLSQRRRRSGARFQCAALHRWDPGATVSLLALDPQQRARAVQDLRGAAAAVHRSPPDLVEAFVASLPP